MGPIRNEEPATLTIGGHFSSVLDERDFSPPGRYAYESARACLYALVRAVEPRRVHIPNYICDVIPNVLRQASCLGQSYPIGNDFCVAGEIDFEDGDLILFVNYYGLCEAAIKRQLEKFPRNAVIVDNSQAYFQTPFPCLANIYSPRKFIPVPDGGFIATEMILSAQQPDEDASLRRYRYLVKRVGSEPEPSRQDYLAAEESLETPTLREMSTVTRALIRTADHDFISKRRRANFRALDNLLGANKLKFEIDDQVPLTYPLMVNGGNDLRKILIGMRIFTPLYWPAVVPLNKFEEQLIGNTLFIPIDHRIDEQNIEYIYHKLSSLLPG